MSCPCSFCHSLGALDMTADSVATTLLPEEIKRHAEIHRKQLRFFMDEDSNAVESAESNEKLVTDKGSSKTSVRGLFEVTEKRKSLEDHCRAIPLKSQIRDKGAFCNLCRSVKVVLNGQSLYAPYAIRHAQVHMGKQTYICRYCDRRSTTLDSMQKHLKSLHNIVGEFSDHFDDESGNYFEEIKDMITRCFDSRSEPSGGPHLDKTEKAYTTAQNVHAEESSMSRMPSQGSQTKQRSSNAKFHVYAKIRIEAPMDSVNPNGKEPSIAAHCRSILPNRRQGSDNLAMCSLCRQTKAVYHSRGQASPQLVLRHVQRHMGRSFYSCKLCDAQFASIDCIQKHMRTTHQDASSDAADNYEDKTDDFSKDIKDMITKCFGQSDGQGPTHRQSVQSKITKQVQDNRHNQVQHIKPRRIMPKPRPNPSHVDHLTTVRQAHCWRLVQNVKTIGQIQCKQCIIPVSFSPTQGNAPSQLRRHIFSKHLPHLAVYRCRLCPFKTAVYHHMYFHLKQCHNSASLIGNFINHANDFHEEIMTELTACFDSGGSHGSALGNVRSITKRTHSAKDMYRMSKPRHTGARTGKVKTGRKKDRSSLLGRLGRNRDPFFRRVTDQCIEHIRKTNAKTIDCQLCPKSRLATYPSAMIHHVEAIHLRKDTYGCRRCTHRFFSYQAMGMHLRKRHKLSRTEGQYVYCAEENHVEMISVIKECFDRDFVDGKGIIRVAPASSVAAGLITGDSQLGVGPTAGDCRPGTSACCNVSSSRRN